jgi:hypothetical protein
MGKFPGRIPDPLIPGVGKVSAIALTHLLVGFMADWIFATRAAQAFIACQVAMQCLAYARALDAIPHVVAVFPPLAIVAFHPLSVLSSWVTSAFFFIFGASVGVRARRYVMALAVVAELAVVAVVLAATETVLRDGRIETGLWALFAAAVGCGTK